MTCKRDAFCFGHDCVEFINCPEVKPVANLEIDRLMIENRALKEKLHQKEEELADMKIQVRGMLKRCGVRMP